jgi:predicted nucleic acid-binding protein
LTRVFVDTGAFVASRRPDESEHTQAREAFEALVARGARLVSTDYVFSETYTTLLTRVGRRAAIAWGTQMRAGTGIEFVRVEQELDDAAWEILVAHEDNEWSYVDAVSIALMEREGIRTAFAFDHHFSQRGLAVIPG